MAQCSHNDNRIYEDEESGKCVLWCPHCKVEGHGYSPEEAFQDWYNNLPVEPIGGDEEET